MDFVHGFVHAWLAGGERGWCAYMRSVANGGRATRGEELSIFRHLERSLEMAGWRRTCLQSSAGLGRARSKSVPFSLIVCVCGTA